VDQQPSCNSLEARNPFYGHDTIIRSLRTKAQDTAFSSLFAAFKSISFWCELGEAAKQKTDSKNDAKNENNKTIVNQY
jgi:hypothetical protein